MKGIQRFLVLVVIAGFLALPVVAGVLMSAQADSTVPTHSEFAVDAPKAPPAEPIYEVDAGDRPGYVRAAGYWKWTGDKFMWMPGRWIAQKPDSVWVDSSWAQRGKKWHLLPGHWERDENAPEPAAEVESNAPADTSETAAMTSDSASSDVKPAAKKNSKIRHSVKPPAQPDYGSDGWQRIMHH